VLLSQHSLLGTALYHVDITVLKIQEQYASFGTRPCN